MFPLVQEMAATGAPIRVPVTVACRVLGFSKQAYYQWLKHPVSAREREQRHLIGVLRRLHDNDEEGGYRVLADDIRDLGYEVSERRVWRLCRVAGIRSTIVSRKTRYRPAGDPVGDDLILRDFTAEYLDEKWLVDITEHWTNEGRLYLCAFKDVCSRRIVGYAIDSRMKASLAVRALQNALINRGHPKGVIVHSDRGGQGGFNRSSQHPDDGGVWWRRRSGVGSPAMFPRVRVGSGALIGRYGRRCGRPGGLSLRGLCSGSSGG